LEIIMNRPVRNRFLLVAALLLSTLFATACGNTYSRDDFMTGVIGKSEQEVTAKFGKPLAVTEESPDRVTWIYARETFDLANQNRIDSKTTVIFEGTAGSRHATKVDFS
jgi:hypothetical protein